MQLFSVKKEPFGACNVLVLTLKNSLKMLYTTVQSWNFRLHVAQKKTAKIALKNQRPIKWLLADPSANEITQNPAILSVFARKLNIMNKDVDQSGCVVMRNLSSPCFLYFICSTNLMFVLHVLSLNWQLNWLIDVWQSVWSVTVWVFLKFLGVKSFLQFNNSCCIILLSLSLLLFDQSYVCTACVVSELTTELTDWCLTVWVFLKFLGVNSFKHVKHQRAR